MINKIMKKYGYYLMKEDEDGDYSENKYGVYYEKQEKQGYTHVVCIVHKKNGKHIMQSYDKTVINVNGNYINEGCGVNIPILLLMWIKARTLSFRYNW